MELYACGFNAWNQLRFDGVLEEEPHDLSEFQCVLSDEFLDVLVTGYSSSLVRTSSGLRLSGEPDELTKYVHENPSMSLKIAEASNGKIAAPCSQGAKICVYNSWTDYPEEVSNAWDLDQVEQVISGHTSFAVLSAGKVWTWGDERYNACLGRETSRHGTSSKSPGLVTDLEDLPTGPICKVTAGGYTTAALTAGHDLYLWGVNELLGLSGNPTPLDMNGMDILDVGVGDGHMVVLTSQGRRVWVIGEGSNGQLGLGLGVDKLSEWREVDLKLDADKEIVGVMAGPKSSFVLVEIGK